MYYTFFKATPWGILRWCLAVFEMNSDNIDDFYNNSIKSTEEVALDTLPKKKIKSNNKPSHSPNVTQAREHL